jgi:hypothetical protein
MHLKFTQGRKREIFERALTTSEWDIVGQLRHREDAGELRQQILSGCYQQLDKDGAQGNEWRELSYILVTRTGQFCV